MVQKIQELVVPKDTQKFLEMSSIIFCRFSQKKSLGSVLFSRDGRVTGNIHIFFGLMGFPT